MQLAVDLLPIAPACWRQEMLDWVASAHDRTCGLVGNVRVAEGCFTPRRMCHPVCNLSPQRLLIVSQTLNVIRRHTAFYRKA